MASSVDWTTNPAMAALLQSMMPMINKAANAGMAGQGIFTDVSRLMPNAGWFSGLSPEIKQGLWEPYNEAALNMINTMGGQGLLSARGGYSGQAQSALGELYSKAGTNVGLNAWNMMSPIQNLGFTNPWNMLPQYAGVGSQLTPNAVVKPDEPNYFEQMAPIAGMFGLNYLFNGGGLGKIASWL